MASLILLRHTRPDIDSHVCYGQLDIDVKSSFENEARQVAREIQPPDFIVSSPLRRCQKLAEFMAKTIGGRYVVDSRLSEMNFGRWEGQPWNDIPRAELDAWAADFLTAAPHGGESVQSLNDRVASCLDEARQLDRSTLWVTHAGVIKSARYLMAEAPADFDWQATVDFGQLTKLY